MSRATRKKLLYICWKGVGAQVDIQGWGEERWMETVELSKIVKGGDAVFYLDAPPPTPHFQVLTSARAGRGKLPSARPSGSQSRDTINQSDSQSSIQ